MRDPIREARRQWIAHGWDAAADGMAMVTSLTRAHQLLSERIDAVLRPLGLTFARYEILQLLAFTRSGALPMTKLGSLLQVHPTSVTSAVDRLELQGYVARSRGEADKRVVLASLTPEGRAMVAKATDGLNAEVFEKPGIDAVAELTSLLTDLRANHGDATE